MDAKVIEAAKHCLGPERGPILDSLAACKAGNLEWYLKRKIISAANEAQRRDHGRVLKYAYNFCRHGANVTFLQERSRNKTSDLKVEAEQGPFYVEVKKFRSSGNFTSTNPVSKIVGAVTEKRNQLPSNAVGFVAIDNFDVELESDDDVGLTHQWIVQALCELERSVAENPDDWGRPGGVIIAANTSGGVNATTPSIPHFIWMNRCSVPPVPAGLGEWLSRSLPDGTIFDPSTECPEVEEKEHQP